MANLIETKVRFDEENHQYFLGAKELKGITKRIHEKCAPTLNFEFANTSLGSAVHSDIESINLSLSFGMTAQPETNHGVNYLAWLNQCGMTAIKSEYIVSDCKEYASPIDIVFEDCNGDIIICDVKTYRNVTALYRNMLQWQLSIYAYLFELVNGFAPKKVFGLQVTDAGCNEIEITTFASDKVQEFLYNDDFNPYTLKSASTTLDKITSLSSIYETLQNQAKAIEENLDTLKSQLMEEMEENGYDKLKQGAYTFTRVASVVKKTFDSKSFLAEHPEYADSYQKETTTKAYLKVTKGKS